MSSGRILNRTHQTESVDSRPQGIRGEGRAIIGADPLGRPVAAKEPLEYGPTRVDRRLEQATAAEQEARRQARIFLRRRSSEEVEQHYTVTIWLNMDSAAEVDELCVAWKDCGVPIVKDLQTAPYNLREFTAQDLDGNTFRVFYDLGGTGK